jgi:hypothetical protein
MHMRHTRILSLAFLSLLTFMLNITARANDAIDDEYGETTRVARISLLRGDVSLQRAGSSDWEQATINLPLVEGDWLATARDARLEIQIDARNFVRVGENSFLQVVTLRDEGIALSLAEGTAMLRLARFDHDREYFEIDAPKTTIAAEKRGLYRLDVGRDGSVRVTVRDDGRACIYSETSGFTLRDGRSAELFYDGSEAGDWELSSAPPLDDWDRWTEEREHYLAARLRYEDRERYYDQDVWGAEELDAYGDWVYADDYGWVWRPNATYINSYQDWSPYRYGHWRWCRPFGWTWVSDEPWGWAPYHYGRWVYYNHSWCWGPRGYGYNYRRSRWHPALVAFVFQRDSYGDCVAWYPLRRGQRDPHYWDGRPVPPGPPGSDDISRVQPDSIYLRAVTSVPTNDFGKYGVRPRPAPQDLAQRVITSPPVRGPLPIVPADTRIKDRAGTNDGTRVVVVTPERVTPPRSLPPVPRTTGAATRKPGAALDDELRRSRVYQGREPSPAPSAGTDDVRGSNAGAVTRPRPVPPVVRPPVERRVGGGKTSGDGAPPAPRPVRQRAPNAQEEEERPSSSTPNVNGRPERERERPATRRVEENRDERPPVERRSQPPRTEQPRERPSPPVERERTETKEHTSAPVERTQPEPPRQQTPAERKETGSPPSESKQQRKGL